LTSLKVNNPKRLQCVVLEIKFPVLKSLEQPENLSEEWPKILVKMGQSFDFASGKILQNSG